MKFFPRLIIILVAVFISNASFAQSGVPMEYRASYNKMMSNNAMNFANMNMQMMMNMRMNRVYGYMENLKYKFKVLMKDSSVKVMKSKIYMDTTLHKSYLTYEDKAIKDKKLREKRIYSNQTISISRDDFNEDITGMANDTCWLFKVISGKINAYSPLSEKYDLNNVYLSAYQVGNGPVVKLDSASLVAIIAKSPKALNAFRKKNYNKAIDKYNSDKTVAVK